MRPSVPPLYSKKLGLFANDMMQLDILAGLRIMEHLGRSRPSTHETFQPQRDSELIQILNWLSLCLACDTSAAYHDVAVAISAVEGCVTVYLVKGDACPPTSEQRHNVETFMSILRRALLDGADPVVTGQYFLCMLAMDVFPAFAQRAAQIGETLDGGNQATMERFHRIVNLWLRYYPRGEQSPGFVDMARKFGGEKHATEMMLECVYSLVFLDAVDDPSSADMNVKYAYMDAVLRDCVLALGSTFFADLTQERSKFRTYYLEIDDLLFVYKLFRRISAVALYRTGCSVFIHWGIPFLRRVLGDSGLACFQKTRGADGIIVNWITTSALGEAVQPHPKGYFRWPSSPEVKVGQLLRLNNLSLEHLEDDELDEIAHHDPVMQLWTKGETVEPIHHAELLMIQFFERDNSVSAVGKSIGMNNPPCWACHFYMQKRRMFWKMSHTTGRPRGDWRLPPCSKNVSRNIVRALYKHVENSVEEYALESCPVED